MNIEPTPASEHLVEIYRRLPDPILEAEEIRIREVMAELGGKLLAINQVREPSNEHTVSA